MKKEFDLNDYLKDYEIIADDFEDIDDKVVTLYHKEVNIGKGLQLSLYTSGYAVLDFNGFEIVMFYWDEEADRLFQNIDNVKIAELFDMVYDKRCYPSFRNK